MLPYLKINNWQFIFIALEFLTCCVVGGLFKAITFYLQKKKINKFVIFFIDFFTGIVFSILFFLLIYFYQFFIIKQNNIYFLPCLTITFIYLLAINKHFLIAVSSYALLIIQLLFFGKWSLKIDNIFCLILMIISLCNIILNIFIKKTNKQYVILSCIINYILSCLLLVVITFSVNKQFNYLIDIFLVSMISVCVTIILYSLGCFIVDVAKKVTGKSKQFVYTEEHFVLPKLISSYFNNLLKTSQDKHYWIITFYIENLDEIKKKLPLNKYQEIEQEYLDQITLKFKQFGGFLYKSKYGLYGAILPIRQSFISDLKCEYNGNLKESRDNEDTLKKYETILASLKKTINIGHESFQIQTKMVVSIYGIHSVDIDELIDCNYLYLKQFIVFDNSLAKNYIQLLNPKYLLKINEQVQTYQKVLNLINQAEFDIELQKIKINNKIYLKPQFFWLKKFTCNLSKILSYFDQKSGCLLQRYLALKAIEKYSLTKKQYQLIVDYPINELNNITFSADKILSKINIFNLTNNDIVLHFSGKNFVYDDVFVKNLKSLDTNKIIYILDNESHLQTKYNFKH